VTAAREQIACLVSPAGDAGRRAAGVAAYSAELERLGRDAAFLLLDDGNWPEPASIALSAGHSVELVRGPVQDGYGDRLRRGLSRAGAELILRLPAAGLSPEFLKALLSRINTGKAKPDIVVGIRPDRPASLWQRLRRRFHERVIRTVFGTLVSDPMCPVWALRRRVLRESLPQSHGEFADFELPARANFVGYLIDELPLKSAWTGGPPPPADWRSICREARALMRRPAFVVRTSPKA
jgi:hypothetical protein